MKNDLTSPSNNALLLQHAPSGKNEQSRLRQYLRWLNAENRAWLDGNLTDYSAYLVSPNRSPRPLSPASANAHLSTIRKQIKRVLDLPQTRQQLFALASQRCIADGYEANPANLAVYVNEVERALLGSIHPTNTKHREIIKQDRPDTEHTRLTFDQANALLNAPDIASTKGLRDLALIAFLLCTGLREQELCDLRVFDLRQTVDGVLGVLVREGKGNKQRVVPYGANEWVLVILDKWLERLSQEYPIETDTLIFRGINKGGHTILSTPLTTRSVQRILKNYPIMIHGDYRPIKPHDLRRTYARRLYDDGTDLLSIQYNLGHANQETTRHYIGDTTMQRRQPTRGYTFDLSKLSLSNQRGLRSP